MTLELTVPFTYPYFTAPFSAPTAPFGPYYLTTSFTYPYCSGGSVAAPMVPPPYPWNVSIGGHDYQVDTSFEPYRREAFRHRSIAAQKSNITVDNVPGEGTVDSQGFWRRIAQDWSLGAGQLYFDRRQSVDNRFRRSKGIDPWVQWQVTLLPATKSVYATANDVVKPVMAGQTLYVLDGHVVKFSTDLVTWTAMVTIPADVADIATNGTTVWFASPTKGLWSAATGSTTSNIDGTPPMDHVAFCGDRLMGSFGPKLYNITATPEPHIATLTAPTGTSPITSLSVTATTVPVNSGDQIVLVNTDFSQTQTFVCSADAAAGAVTLSISSATPITDFGISSYVEVVNPLFTHENPNWIWNSFAYGSSQVYVGGYVNTTPPSGPSAVYRTTVDSNGIDLTVPVQALPLEGGEWVSCLGSYLNLLFVGTNLGLRMCQTLAAYDPTGNQGDLKSGPLVPSIIQPVTKPVTGVVGNGRFIWFTWNDYDSQSTGVGRCDLSHFIDTLAPAYASDLMVSGQGTILLAWCPLTDSPVMGVANSGLWVADNESTVTTGSLKSGLLTYGIPDPKIAMTLGYRTNGDGVVEGAVSVEPLLLAEPNGTVTCIDTAGGTYGVTTPGQALSQWDLPQLTGEFFEITTTLKLDTELDAPIVTRWMLQSIAAVTAGIEISCVVMLYRTVETRGLLEPFDAYKEYLYLETLRRTQQVVYFVEGPFKVLVTIDSLDWLPHAEEDATPNRGYHGDIVVYMKTWSMPSVAEVPPYLTSVVTP